MYIRNSLTALMLVIPLTSVAQSSVEKEQQEQIVVTGTRTAKLLSDSPVLVEVVSGDIISKISQGTLGTALNLIPGVVVERSPKDGYNIQMQGFSSKHVLVLVDGQPLISPTDSSADLDQISASNILQIEVVRGAASVMYGSSAMGGVINIITNQHPEDGLRLSYDISQYHDTIDDNDINHTVKLSASGEVLGWNTTLNTLLIDDQGFDYDPTTVSQDAASVDKKFVTLRTSKANEKFESTFKVQWLDELKRRDSSIIPGQSGIIFYQTEVIQQQLDAGVKSLNKPLEPWELNVRYSMHQENSGQSNSKRDTDIELFELNGLKVFQLGDLELVSGGNVHLDQLNQVKPLERVIEIDDKGRESIEGYVQANWDLGSTQILTGMRGQYDSDFGGHGALRINVMERQKLANGHLSWRAGLGQSYRVPNLKERFYIFDHSALGYMVLGNDALVPETANSFNASARFNTALANNSVDFSSHISVHYSKSKNLIESVIDPVQSTAQGLSIYEYQNISESTRSGFDVSGEIKFNQWQMQLNYSYLDSEKKDGTRLLSQPRHQVKLNLIYDLGYDSQLIAYGVYQADEAISADYNAVSNNEYAIFNVVFTQQLTNELSWRFSADNLLNEHKEPSATRQNLFDARPINSRVISAGISYQF